MTNYYEVAPLADHHLRMAYGPATLLQPGCDRIAERIAEFSKVAAAPAPRALLDWWLGKIGESGQVPVNDRGWIVDLAPWSRLLILGELEAESGQLRYRYFGEDVATRLGVELSGRRFSDFNGMSEEALWQVWGPVAEEGRPIYLQIGYGGLLAKSFVKADMVAVPLRDDGGQVRYGLAGWSFPETDFS